MSTLELTAKICADKLCAITVGNVPSEHTGPSELSTRDNGDSLEIETPLVPIAHVPVTVLSIRNEEVQFLDSSTSVLKHTPNGEVIWLWWGKYLGTPIFAGRNITAENRGTSVLRCTYDANIPVREMFVETYIQPEGVTSLALCKIEDSMFTWELLGHPFVGVYGDLGAYWIKITAENIDLCNFEGAKIKGEFAGTIKEYLPTSGGLIPTRTALSVTDEEVSFINSNKASLEHTPDGDVTWLWKGNYLGTPRFDGKNITSERRGTSVLKCSYDTFLPADDALEIADSFDNTNDPQIQGDPLVVPGERISLWWKIGGVDNYEEVAHAFIHTCLLTGGRVEAISGDYGDPSITYSVRIEGNIHEEIKPSDFREYTVGEWVYIMKAGASGAGDCGREAGCKGGDYIDLAYTFYENEIIGTGGGSSPELSSIQNVPLAGKEVDATDVTIDLEEVSFDDSKSESLKHLPKGGVSWEWEEGAPVGWGGDTPVFDGKTVTLAEKVTGVLLCSYVAATNVGWPQVFARINDLLQIVYIGLSGVCLGDCLAGILNLETGEWATDITWRGNVDSGTNITISYYTLAQNVVGVIIPIHITGVSP